MNLFCRCRADSSNSKVELVRLVEEEIVISIFLISQFSKFFSLFQFSVDFSFFLRKAFIFLLLCKIIKNTINNIISSSTELIKTKHFQMLQINDALQKKCFDFHFVYNGLLHEKLKGASFSTTLKSLQNQSLFTHDYCFVFNFHLKRKET